MTEHHCEFRKHYILMTIFWNNSLNISCRSYASWALRPTTEISMSSYSPTPAWLSNLATLNFASGWRYPHRPKAVPLRLLSVNCLTLWPPASHLKWRTEYQSTISSQNLATSCCHWWMRSNSGSVALCLFLFYKWWGIQNLFPITDSPGHGRIGGHYFHAWCPYVRPKQKRTATQTLVPGQQNTRYDGHQFLKIMIIYLLWPGGSFRIRRTYSNLRFELSF